MESAEASESQLELSVAVPCYNEEANVVAIHEAITREVGQVASSYEIIFIDNGSTDRTRSLLREICQRDPHTRAIFNNRNYGQMRSPTYAIFQSEGRGVIAMCSDFQDPPALIPELVRQWRAGAQVVLGRRRTEDAPFYVTLVRRLGYAFFRRFGDTKIIPGATGFGLFDREVVDMLASWNEPEPFVRGMVIESGYRIAVVPYDRPARAGGRSSNGFWTLLNFALSGIVGSAKSLLRLQLVAALFMTVAALALGVATAVRFALVGYSPLLLTLTVMIGLFSLVFLFLGLIADQVRVIAERLRNVPLVIEEERLNFSDARSLPAERVVSRRRLPGRP